MLVDLIRPLRWVTPAPSSIRGRSVHPPHLPPNTGANTWDTVSHRVIISPFIFFESANFIAWQKQEQWEMWAHGTLCEKAALIAISVWLMGRFGGSYQIIIFCCDRDACKWPYFQINAFRKDHIPLCQSKTCFLSVTWRMKPSVRMGSN